MIRLQDLNTQKRIEEQRVRRHERWQCIKSWASNVGRILIVVYFVGVMGALTYRSCHLVPKMRQERDQHEPGCHRGDLTSCKQLLLLVDRPCREDHQTDACRRLAFIEAQGIATWPNQAASAAHYGIACGGGDPLACRVVRDCVEKSVPFTQCEAAQVIATRWYGR